MVDGKENDGWILILNGKYCVTLVFLPREIYPLHVIWHAYGNQNINTWHSASFWMISTLFLTVLWMSWLSGLVWFFDINFPCNKNATQKMMCQNYPKFTIFIICSCFFTLIMGCLPPINCWINRNHRCRTHDRSAAVSPLGRSGSTHHLESARPAGRHRPRAAPRESGYPAWWTNIAMENDHRNSGFSH